MLGKIFAFITGFVVGTLFGWKIVAMLIQKFAGG